MRVAQLVNAARLKFGMEPADLLPPPAPVPVQAQALSGAESTFTITKPTEYVEKVSIRHVLHQKRTQDILLLDPGALID